MGASRCARTIQQAAARPHNFQPDIPCSPDHADASVRFSSSARRAPQFALARQGNPLAHQYASQFRVQPGVIRRAAAAIAALSGPQRRPTASAKSDIDARSFARSAKKARRRPRDRVPPARPPACLQSKQAEASCNRAATSSGLRFKNSVISATATSGFFCPSSALARAMMRRLAIRAQRNRGAKLPLGVRGRPGAQQRQAPDGKICRNSSGRATPPVAYCAIAPLIFPLRSNASPAMNLGLA